MNKKISGLFNAALLVLASSLMSSDTQKDQPVESKNNDPITENIETLAKEEVAPSYDIEVTDKISLTFSDQQKYFNMAAELEHADIMFTSHNKSPIPKELRRPIHLLQQISGVPHQAFLMIAKAESNFKPSMEKKPNVTTLGYFQFNRDTTYANIQKTKSTPWENLFLVSSLIEKGEYNDGRVRMHIEDPADRGKEDRELTLNYHRMIAEDFFSQGILATIKIKDDYKQLKRANIDPTHLDIYAKWFYGSGGGQKFSKLRRNEPDAPIWRIYGNDLDEVLKNHAAAFNHPVNKNLYYNKDGTFKSIAETVDYLKTTKNISDDKFIIYEPDDELIKHITVNGKHIAKEHLNGVEHSDTDKLLIQDQLYKEAHLEL